MADVSYDLVATIGLDFGSSTTKVCYRIESADIDKKGVVKFSGNDVSSDGLLLDSVVYVAGDWQFISHKEFAFSRKVSYFKTHLVENSLGVDELHRYKEVCSFYIAYVIGAAMDYIEHNESKVLSGHPVLWIVSLGVPVDQDGLELHRVYEEMAKVAVLRHKEAFRFYLMSLDRWHTYYQSSLDGTMTNMHYHLTPELLAEVADVFEDPEVDEGLSIVVDVGSATVDIAIVNLDRHSNSEQYNVDFISAKVGTLGVDNTVRYIESEVGKNHERPIKQALLEQSGFGLVYRYMNEYQYHIHDLEGYGDTLVDKFHGLFADVCMQAKRSPVEYRLTAMREIPLYLLGGGNCYYWYQSWPEAAHRARLASCGIPKCDHQKLYHQPDIAQLDKGMYHRFRVASGLLKLETMLKVTGYPSHFRMDNHPIKTVSLHERLEARLAEKYGK